MSEGINTRAVVAVGLGTLAITAILVAIAWLLVAPTPAGKPLPPPNLETGGFAQRPQLGVAVPVDQAIDRVVADPSLIGGRK